MEPGNRGYMYCENQKFADPGTGSQMSLKERKVVVFLHGWLLSINGRF